MPPRGSDQSINDVKDLLTALRDVTGELTTLGGVVRTAGSVIGTAFSSTIGFSANAGFRSAQRFTRDTFVNAMSDQVRLGGNFQDNLTASALRSGRAIPILGGLFGREVDPIEAAGGRAAGITTMIARAGGRVTPAMRQALFDRFKGEELRAQSESEKIDRIVNREIVKRGGESFDVGLILQEVLNELREIKNFWRDFFRG